MKKKLIILLHGPLSKREFKTFGIKYLQKKMSPHIKETIFYSPNKYSQNSLQKNFEKSYGEGNFVYEHVKPIEYLSRYRQNNEMLIKYLPSKGKHWFSKCNIEKFKKQIMQNIFKCYIIFIVIISVRFI